MKILRLILSSKLFLIGLLIRLLVMPFTGHIDIRGINFAVYQFPFHHVTNIYEVVESGPLDYLVNVNFGRDYFIYPPPTYFTLGAIMSLLKPLYGSEFVNWINGYGTDVTRVLTHPHVFRYLFLMKVPYLLCDFLMLLALYKLLNPAKERNNVLKYWWLNPIVIFIPYILGQFDLIPAAITVLGVYLTRKNPYWGVFAIGLAAAFKMYPLIFLPLIVIVLAQNWKQFITLSLAAITPFILSILPYLSHSFFRETVLFSAQSQKMLDMAWGIGGDTGLYPFVIGYTLITFWVFYYGRARQDIVAPIVMTLMLYYATTTFHLQWLIWVLPFLALYAAKFKSFLPLLMFIIVVFFLQVLTSTAGATTELLVWTAPVFDDLPKFRELLNSVYEVSRMRNIISSFFAAAAIWIIGTIIRDKKVRI